MTITTLVASSQNIDKARQINELEKHVLNYSGDSSNTAMLAMLNKLYGGKRFRYPDEVFEVLRKRYDMPEDDGGYNKLKHIADRWIEAGNLPETTDVYGILGIPKSGFNSLFSEDTIDKVTQEYGFKKAERYGPDGVMDDTYRKAMLIPSENIFDDTIPEQKLMDSSEKLNHRVARLNSGKDISYIDDLFPEGVIHLFHPQVVLYVAAKNEFNILKYSDSTYQANGKRVVAQPQVITEINRHPEKIIEVMQ